MRIMRGLLILIFVTLTLITKCSANENKTVNLITKLLKSLTSINFGLEEKIGRDVKPHELTYQYFSSFNRGNESYLDPQNPKELFGGNGKIFFLIHGWFPPKLHHWYFELTNKLLGRFPESHVVHLNWESASFQDFGSAAYSTESIGSHIATFIENLVENHDISLEDIVLIGHSMGAHICGWTGRYFTSLTGKKLWKIIALDPIGFIFNDRPDTRKLSRNDAYVVHVIHTDKNRIGYDKPCGTIDFYPNGGQDQPGCEVVDLDQPLQLIYDTAYCNHFRSYEYFIEAVSNPGSFVAHRCPNENVLNRRNCDGTEVTMGELSLVEEGIYYLETHPKPPYSKVSIEF